MRRRMLDTRTRVLAPALAFVAAYACGAHPAATYHVDAATGSDANSGTATSPFKSISQGLRVARNKGDVVLVAPGVYGSATGEAFPLRVPDGVALLGDEENRGAGSYPTAIVGGNVVSRGFNDMGITAAIDPGEGSTIAGFTITNDNPVPQHWRYGVFVGAEQQVVSGGPIRHDNVAIRNNTVTGALHDAAIAFTGQGADGHVVTRNRIVDNLVGAGIRLGPGGVGSRLEDNVITGNYYGVVLDVPGDLGGGPARSAGRNVISCNSYDVLIEIGPFNEDLWQSYPPDAVPASNGFWDHVPPVVCRDTWDLTCDIFFSAPRQIEVTTSDAGWALSACP